MSKTTLGFIFSGMIYLLIGIVLGILFVVAPDTKRLVPLHVHLNLVGFVMFLIFGIAYHILPRFRGRPLYSERLAWWQFLLANTGLFGFMSLNGIGAYREASGLRTGQAAFGALLGLSIAMFVFNMIKTLYLPQKEAAK